MSKTRRQGSLIPARYSGTMKTEYKNVHTKLHLLRSPFTPKEGWRVGRRLLDTQMAHHQYKVATAKAQVDTRTPTSLYSSIKGRGRSLTASTVEVNKMECHTKRGMDQVVCLDQCGNTERTSQGENPPGSIRSFTSSDNIENKRNDSSLSTDMQTAIESGSSLSGPPTPSTSHTPHHCTESHYLTRTARDMAAWRRRQQNKKDSSANIPAWRVTSRSAGTSHRDFPGFSESSLYAQIDQDNLFMPRTSTIHNKTPIVTKYSGHNIKKGKPIEDCSQNRKQLVVTSELSIPNASSHVDNKSERDKRVYEDVFEEVITDYSVEDDDSDKDHSDDHKNDVTSKSSSKLSSSRVIEAGLMTFPLTHPSVPSVPSVPLCTSETRSSRPLLSTLECVESLESKYLTFLSEITQDILAQEIYFGRGLDMLLQRHIDRYRRILDVSEMKRRVKNLKEELNISYKSD